MCPSTIVYGTQFTRPTPLSFTYWLPSPALQRKNDGADACGAEGAWANGVAPGAAASTTVAAALKLIDDDRVGGIISIATGHAEKAKAINSDNELSDLGKRERVKAAARSDIVNAASVAKKLTDLEAQHRQAKSEAVPLPKPDAAEVLMDLALLAHVKATNPTATALTMMSERIRLAVARSPVELSGVKPEAQARVHGSLISPEVATRLEEEAEALSIAREMVQSAIDELAPSAGLSPLEAVTLFGTKWHLPGVTDSMAQRLAAEAGCPAE